MARALPQDPTLLQILSLYLLLLAFFVLLFNLSRVEDAKSRAVAESLHSTFSPVNALGDSPDVFVSLDGDVLNPPKIEETVGALVKTEIPVAEIQIIKPGRLLQLRVPIHEMFVRGESRIRPDREDLVRRIATAMVDAPRGVRYDLEIMLARWRGPDDEWRPTENLSVARAGRFAARLIDAGAPSGTVAGGVAAGEAGWLRMLFHARPRTEARLRLDPAIRPAIQENAP